MGSRGIADSGNEDESKVKWLDLPADVLSVIAAKLIIKDQILFGSVCRGWQSVHNEVRRIHGLRRPLPVLLCPTEDDDTTQTCNLYSLAENNLCDFTLEVPRRYWPGSSYGWLVTVTFASDDQDAEITLLNPFFNNEIHLPPLTAFQLPPLHDGIWSHYFLERAVVSADPSSNPNSYVVMAIYGQFQRLAFCRPGEKVWTTLSSEIFLLEDIIFYKDQFYAIDRNEGNLWACDLVNLTLSKVAAGPGSCCKRYLVESASTGELLQVLRQIYKKEEYNRTKSFDVFKFDFDKREWIRMHDHLQGCTLFVGDNTSLSLFASDYNNPLGCQPNSIYFTDDHHEAHYSEAVEGRERVPEKSQLDMGVFHFRDRYTRPHYPNRCTKFVPAPIWIDIRKPSSEEKGNNV